MIKKHSPSWWKKIGDVLYTTINAAISVGGTASGQSKIASGLVVNEDGGNGANDDFRAETFSNADAFVIDASADEIRSEVNTKVGSSTNYTKFDTEGHMTMTGTAKPWDDLRVEPTVRGTGVNNPTFEKYFDDAAGTSRGVYLYSFNNAIANSEKEVFFTMQMPHSWDGGPIDMHVHWVPAATENATDVVWGLEYVWKDIGEVFGDTTIITSSTTLFPDDANITAGKHYISEFGMLTPGTTADGLSSILIGRLFRNSSNASDTYTDKVGLLYIDAHFQLSSIGSNDEYIK